MDDGPHAGAPPPWLRRLGWLVLLWLGGVAALGLVALALRVLMAAAGMRDHG